jgi:hypothetical protein
MKNLTLSLLGLTLLATPVVAQTNLYDTRNLGTTCVANPYSLKGYQPQEVPTTFVPSPLFDSYAVRYSIAQGAVGTEVATERAYLVISNLEDVDQDAAVKLTVEGMACPLKWEGTVPANNRVVLGLHADPTLIGRPWNFSAVVYFSRAGGDADLVNYTGQQVETGAKRGKLVPR